MPLFYKIAFGILFLSSLARAQNIPLQKKEQNLTLQAPYWEFGREFVSTNNLKNQSGTYSFNIGQTYIPELKLYFDEATLLTRYFYLFGTKEKMTLSFKYRTTGVQDALLILASTNKDLLFDHSDSIKLPPCKEWTAIHHTLNIKEAYSAGLTFEVLFEDMAKSSNKLYLDNFSIKIDGNDFKDPSVETTKIAWDNNLIKETKNPDSLLYQCIINNFSDKQVIGLGETIHYSIVLDSVKYDLAYKLATNQGYKNILIEGASDFIYKWNQYIRSEQNENTELEKKTAFFSKNEKATKAFYQFLGKLKTYNNKKDNNEKISIYGIDAPYNFKEIIVPLLDSLSKANGDLVEIQKRLHYPRKKFQELSLLTKEQQNQYHDSIKLSIPKLREACEKSPQLAKYIGERNYFTLINSLREIEIPPMCHCLTKRDDYMAQSIIKIAQKYPKEKFLILAHWKHLKKGSTYSSMPQIKSMGEIIKNYFSSDYAVLGLLIGNGIAEIGNSITEHLIPSMEGSLEEQCIKTGQKSFYYPSALLPKKPLSIRFGGSSYSAKYDFHDYYIIPQTMDGIIFYRGD